MRACGRITGGPGWGDRTSRTRVGLPIVAAVLATFMPAWNTDASAQRAGADWARKMFDVTEYDFRTVGRGTKSEYAFRFRNPYNEDVHVAALRTSCGCTTPSVEIDTLKTHQESAVVATFNTNTHVGDKNAVITVVFDRPTYAEVQLRVHGNIRTDITFDPPEIDFGRIPAAGADVTRELTVRHIGNPNWRIEDVRSHCEGLRVRLSEPTVDRGGVTYRMVVRMAEPPAEGDIRGRLTIVSNDPRFSTTEVSVRGRVRPALEVSPVSMALGTVASDAIVTRRLIVRGDAPFEIRRIVIDDDRLSCDPPAGSKKLHLLTVRYRGDGSGEPIDGDVTIETDLDGKVARCPVAATVR